MDVFVYKRAMISMWIGYAWG